MILMAIVRRNTHSAFDSHVDFPSCWYLQSIQNHCSSISLQYVHQLTPTQQCTAARAILWQAASLNDSNKTYQSSGGLDCKFLELHGRQGSKGREAWEIQQVQNETLKNLLDVVQFLYICFLLPSIDYFLGLYLWLYGWRNHGSSPHSRFQIFN